MEEVQSRHRKEVRDLQSRITQKKKQANKKSRKGVNDECDRLEAELREKHQAELSGLGAEERIDVETVGEQLDELVLQDQDNEHPPHEGVHPNGHATKPRTPPVAEEDGSRRQGKKPNRQKARLAKRAAEQEEQAKQAVEEAKNLPNMKQQERNRMLEYMTERGLREKEIRADGHCLYSAIADQLEQLQVPLGAHPGEQPTVPYKIVRSAAATYIQRHKDDFVPFLEEPLPEYLHKVRDTGEWGGQLELMALAKTYGIDINVLQDFGRVEKIEAGGSPDGKAIWLGYYKHGFGLGEHYNSLRKVP